MTPAEEAHFIALSRPAWQRAEIMTTIPPESVSKKFYTAGCDWV
jgi:hypothetical protein